MKGEGVWDGMQAPRGPAPGTRPHQDPPPSYQAALESGGGRDWRRRGEVGWTPLPLADRVEKNRHLVRQMLDHALQSTPDTGSITEWDSGVFLQDEEHRQVEAVVEEQQQQVEYPQPSARHEEANRLLEKAHRKSRCSPLRADHTLMAAWPQTSLPRPPRPHPPGPHPPGPPHPAELMSNIWLGGLQPATSPQYGALSDSSSSDSGSAPPHRRPGHSPTRVRFEDETERDAEHRYMERVALRPVGGDRGQGPLLSKPSLTSYLHRQEVTSSRQEVISCRPDVVPSRQEVASGRQEVASRRQEISSSRHDVASCGQEVTSSRQEVGRKRHPRTAYRVQRVVSTERIKETYIGTVTTERTTALAGEAGSWTNQGLPSTNGHLAPPLPGDAQGTASFAADRTLGLPTNPYPTSTPAPPPHAALPQSYWPSPPARPPRGVGLSGRSLSCPGGGESDSLKIAAEGTRAAVDGQAGGPMRGEQQKDNSHSPAQGVGLDCQGAELNGDGVEPSDQRGRPRFSLRQLFSGLRGPGARLRGRRSCSLDHLTSQTLTPQPPTALIQTPQTTARPRTSSLQSFSLGAPLAQLRKSSSIQSLTSGQKKSDRSAAYSPASPAPCRPLQRALSVEDVGAPSGMRWVGRVSQAFPDGSLMLELQRPPAGPYGFLVSRGRGRRDSGVYVEEMDSSVEKLYTGLLGAGDEILEVNGEKVSALCLDAVSRLLTQNPSASVRVLRNRQPMPPH